MWKTGDSARCEHGLGNAPRPPRRSRISRPSAVGASSSTPARDVFAKVVLRRSAASGLVSATSLDKSPDIGTRHGTINIFACIKHGERAYHPAAARPYGFGFTSGGSHEQCSSRASARLNPLHSLITAGRQFRWLLHLERATRRQQRHAFHHAWRQLSLYVVPVAEHASRISRRSPPRVPTPCASCCRPAASGRA